MKISRLTIDKLGVKLYDRVSAVLAELVANSYDADATSVAISAPMGIYLADMTSNGVKDLGYSIVVADDGHGMTPEEMQAHYLVVGAERRIARGEFSKTKNRRVMGRKGVGKLAPFGICSRIEILSSGGEPVDQKGVKVYRTSHIILNRDDMMTPEENDYEPEIGDKDQTLRKTHGTTVTLRLFTHRSVPSMPQLARQMAHRFGVSDPDWKVTLTNVLDGASTVVGPFDIPTMPDTTIRFVGPDGPNDYTLPTEDVSAYHVEGPSGVDVSSLRPYITGASGKYYPIRGWIAYAADSYNDDLEAGVRFYCKKKIAAQTQIFNRGAGFHGEHSIRSYLVGELHLDWLDAENDLIQTDRRDILWSDELGEALEKWGQSVLDVVARIARGPVKQKTWQLFRTAVDVDRFVLEQFPSEKSADIRIRTERAIKAFAENMRLEELNDNEAIENVLRMGILLGPLIALDDDLRTAASTSEPMAVMASILDHAKLAEIVAFGTVAKNRVKVIEKLIALSEGGHTEDAFQELIEGAPWLINPEWAVVTANQPLKNLRIAFERWLKKRAGLDVNLTEFDNPLRKPDFVLTSQENRIEIIEIKKADYAFVEADVSAGVKLTHPAG
jgi:hypothetical protein